MATNIGPKIGVDGEAEYRKQLQNIIQQAKTLSSEMKAVTASFDENTSAVKKAKETAKVLTEQVKVQKDRVAALSDMLKKSSENLGENDTRTLKWKQALNDANAELSQMSEELKDAKKQSNLFLTAIDNLGEKAKDVAKSGLSKLGDAAKSGLKGALNVGVGAVKGLGTTVAAMGTAAATGITALGKIGLDYNSEMEKYTTNFEVMLGSQEAAVAKVESLKKMAASTPFEMAGLADATQQLLAMNVASEDTEKYITQLGDISLGNSEKFNSLVGAFGKMNSTGKVTLEYINMMAEQGFNPLNIIAQQTGETMTQLYDRLSKGNVTLDEVKNAMEIATSTGGQFADGMKKASETTEGMMSTLADNVKSLIGEVFLPVSEGLKNTVLPAAIDTVDKLTSAFRERGIGGMTSAAGEIINGIVWEFVRKLPELVETAGEMVETLAKGIEKNIGEITDVSGLTMEAFFKGIEKTLPKAVNIALDIIEGITAGMAIGGGLIAESGAETVKKLVEGISERLPLIVENAVVIIKAFCESLRSRSGQITSSAVSIIRTLVSGFASMLPDLFVMGAMLLGELAVGLVNEIPTLVSNVPVIINAFFEAFKANSGVFEGIGRNLVISLQNGISSVIGGVISWFKDLWYSVFGSLKIGVSASVGATTTRSVDGSHASGLGYVPFDGYIARLHKGEMVLTKAQAEIIRNAGYMYLPRNNAGGGQSTSAGTATYNYGGQTFNIYQQPGESSEELAERIMEIMQTQVTRKGAAIGG